MKNRTDTSFLLTLSERESQRLQGIASPQLGRATRMQCLRKPLCAVGATSLIGLMTLGVVKPDLAIAIAEWVGLVLAF